MTKKNYIHPALEIVPFGAMVSLCNSGGGETNDTLNGDTGGGEEPWTHGMSPHRTPEF